MLEDWLLEAGLPFVRWAGGCAGSLRPERVIATGDSTLSTCAVTDDDEVILDRGAIEQLGSMEAIRAFFAAANFALPTFHVEDDTRKPTERS